MHVAYLDDSGSDKQCPLVVFGGVVVRPEQFWKMDLRVGIIPEVMMPPDKCDQFEEFHAAELFGGYGAFKEVSEEKRHSAIRALLATLDRFDIPFIYAAVD
jgi:hypothetical protein